MDAAILDLAHRSHMMQFPGFWQGEEQNEGQRKATQRFCGICNGKSCFVDLLGNKFNQN